jgi:hypothetical protein
MSYQGLLVPLARMLKVIDNPRVLEIGLNQGFSTSSLIHNLTVSCDNFLYEGVDVFLQKPVWSMLSNMDGCKIFGLGHNEEDSNVILYEQNSLSLLPSKRDQGEKYDLIFVDGDHNYETVYSELSIIKDMCHPTTIVVCDDFGGRYANEDLYYSETEGYENNEIATKRSSNKSLQGKKGVSQAVIDFIEEQKGAWEASTTASEPVILHQSCLNFGFFVPGDAKFAHQCSVQIGFTDVESLDKGSYRLKKPIIDLMRKKLSE